MAQNKKSLGQIAAEAFEGGGVDYSDTWAGADIDWKHRWEVAALVARHATLDEAVNAIVVSYSSEMTSTEVADIIRVLLLNEDCWPDDIEKSAPIALARI